ncbi:MAG: hypothetical protein VX642_02690 [Bdellovibrionota bacterium]|nr:hypothetical protein [Bdellovibrionota bacterium]
MASKKAIRLLIFINLFLAIYSAAEAKKSPWKTKVEGSFEPQARIYEKDSSDDTIDNYADFYTNFIFKAKRYRDYFTLNLAFRSVPQDDESSQYYAKEAWWMLKNKNFDYLAGVNYFNWSALELFHPFNIINATELFEQEQIGENMLMLRWKGFEKTASFIFLPKITENMYNTSSKSRLGYSYISDSLFVKDDEELYTNTFSTNFALEWKQSLDSLDYRLLLYSGPDRQLELFGFNGTSYNPIVFLTNSFGVNVQSNWFGSIWKFEYLNKSYQHSYSGIEPKSHQVLAFGYEFPSVLDSGGELNYLIEFQTAFGTESEELEQYYTFQNDLFLGLRYSLGDMKGTEYLIGYLKDMSRDAESAFFLEYTTRINSKTQIELGSRFVWAKQKDAFPLGLERQDGDNYIYGKWVYYFR